MISAHSLRLADDPDLEGQPEPQPEPQPEVRPPPKVFVRTLLTPPGWPWEQSRTAELEARLSSPLPAGDAVYRLRRLDAWRPGSPARFAAFYVLAREVDGRLETQAQVDGRDARVVFENAEVSAARAKQLGAVSLAAGAVVFSLVLVVGLALGRRAELEGKLATVEQQASVKLRGVSAKARLKAQEQALRLWRDKGAPMGEVLADLAWISSAQAGRSPAGGAPAGGQIEGVHWEHGLLAVEASGAAPPLVVFGDRRLQRSIKPIRPGVFLWAVERQTIEPSVAEPIAATPLPPGEIR